MEGRCVKTVPTVHPGSFDRPLRLDEEGGEVVGPPLVPPRADGGQLAEVVGVAECVADVVVAVGLPAVVDCRRSTPRVVRRTP
jgi:hypothetical protein